MTRPPSPLPFDLSRVPDLLAGPEPEPARVRGLLDRARSLAGLEPEDAAALTRVRDPGLLGEIFAAARAVKETIYGARLVLFAPLYVSSACANECLYCAFRASRGGPRRVLGRQEIAAETRQLVAEGHKRVLLVAGEALGRFGTRELLAAIETIYATRGTNGDEVRRINVNVAPLPDEGFAALHEAGIGTYQLFQETYHEPTYRRVHVAGPKSDFAGRLAALDRAMDAGIDDVGLGVLFGLHDWRHELVATLLHARHLERRFGVGPHTISVPRLEPAGGAALSERPPAPVSDDELKRVVAILRLAVPYTGLIMSTRESPAMRRATLALGISQISAGSRTNPGGYAAGENEDASQFQLGDHRSLDEVVRDVAGLGYVPSFCTACYRLGRTGGDFMDLAKPGAIRQHCEPNGLATFQEYLEQHGAAATRDAGRRLIDARLRALPPRESARARRLVDIVREGGRDVLV